MNQKADKNNLFTATLIVQGQPIAYDVTFEEDHYTFQPQAEQDKLSSFTVFREHDEWQVKGMIEDVMKQQAVSQLEAYLLSQH